ncbi:hypothetical protein DB346_25135 [Verrucomicrobia bacterium LW23]|nr:hypothetical protein DB346_25135 [Verrucomicrobia bacterium LW23]
MAGLAMVKADSDEESVLLQYRAEPEAFTWHVNGHELGTDLDKIIPSIVSQKPTFVIVKSEHKLTKEKQEEILGKLKAARLKVKEFWVPAETTKEVNILAERKKK